VLYYYSVSGYGKTAQILTTLCKLYELYPEISFYAKMGGLDKYWDGYDNDPIVVIDDPVSSQARSTGNEEAVQRLKNVLSYGGTLVKVKHGSMVFDAKIIIIAYNSHPEELAWTCGEGNMEAIKNRFMNTCGAHEITSKRMARQDFPRHMLLMIQTN